jgi:hypothetical protein
MGLRGRKSRRIGLNRLGAQQAKKVGLIHFRYAARAFAGQYCLKRFATYNACGKLLDVSPPMDCP